MAKKGPGRPKLPKSQHKKRDYKREYFKFKSSDKELAKQRVRNKNRRDYEKAGKVKKGDGKDIHHTKSNKKTVMSAKKNRGKAEASRVKGSKRNKTRWGMY